MRLALPTLLGGEHALEAPLPAAAAPAEVARAATAAVHAPNVAPRLLGARRHRRARSLAPFRAPRARRRACARRLCDGAATSRRIAARARRGGSHRAGRATDDLPWARGGGRLDGQQRLPHGAGHHVGRPQRQRPARRAARRDRHARILVHGHARRRRRHRCRCRAAHALAPHRAAAARPRSTPPGAEREGEAGRAACDAPVQLRLRCHVSTRAPPSGQRRRGGHGPAGHVPAAGGVRGAAGVLAGGVRGSARCAGKGQGRGGRRARRAGGCWPGRGV